ncbi:MAG: ABC transporter substrate-binding protein [Polyangiales bacterium]
MRDIATFAVCLGLALTGCDVFDDDLARRVLGNPDAECRVHTDCGTDPANPTACVQPAGRCVPLLSDDCRDVTGSLASPDALVIGGMFALSGPQAGTNAPRRLSAALAIEQIDAVGGVPGPGATKRPLVLLSCDTARDLDRAATHLIDALRVPAIIGPNTSQDTIDVSNRHSVAAGTLLLSPTAVAASIADLDDDDLTWAMVPSDEQRAPLMRAQLAELEQQLRRERGERPIKLSIIHRDDALGVGTRAALATHTPNGKSLLDNQSASPPSVSIEAYDPAAADQAALVARQRAFAPDLIVLAGTAEAVTRIMVPLEASWPDAPRPHYVTIDSLRVPELLEAAASDDGLRQRVRGTGVLPSARAQPVYETFRLDFQARYRDVPATLSGMGPSYDAAYAIAYALAASREQPVRGRNIAAGLRKLRGGPEVQLSGSKVLSALHELAAGRAIDAVGSFGVLGWNERGAPLGGRVEMWCIGGKPPAFASSGLTLDLESGQVAGGYRQCGQPTP